MRPGCCFVQATYPSLFYKFTQPPQPYSFGYDNTDEFGTQTFHKEQGDASNTKTGSYGYRDEYGIFRRVNYVADANGFRATIDTNEPGTAAGRSADAVFNANPVAAPVRAKSASAPFPTYVAAPVYGSGYTAPGVCNPTHILFKRTQPPKPYSFGYDTVDEFGTQSFHNEQSDANNVKKGSYGYRDAHGIYRRVNYVADHNGFRATIDSNEPETTSGRSANAVFNSKPLAAPVAARPAAAPFDARPAAAPFAARPAAAPFAARPAAAPFDARPAAAQFAARPAAVPVESYQPTPGYGPEFRPSGAGFHGRGDFGY
ncbi:hypothetical protein HPB48_021438 [Haemaphysalis longicornis]|uniref:Cuticle protein n=1 Tax=Haemaphysalis longicornis TaxID=44386 RepID=A0A9J6G8H8_HAELO|nr:hypothetical protein HPB48_021438 [Haemaphysalis longicornis]